MRIRDFINTRDMAIAGASIIKYELRLKPELLLCAATGNSPLLLYKQLVLQAEKDKTLFQKFRLMPLDEWIGLSSSAGSCHAYLNEHILNPLKISDNRYLRFHPEAKNLELELLRIQGLLQEHGPIDLCVLGLGKNGHLGLNEPAKVLQDHCHIADLTPQSRDHNMLQAIGDMPTQGLTLGMKDILSSKRVLLIISGDGKEDAKRALFSKEIDSQCPASYLWQHNNVDCFVLT